MFINAWLIILLAVMLGGSLALNFMFLLAFGAMLRGRE